MTKDEAIASLLETCQNLKEAIEQLQEENAFLADTIVKNNLDQIKSERRSLLEETEQCKKDSAAAIKSANELKAEYESKTAEVNTRLEDIKKKQSDLDFYIESEATKKVENIKLEYENLTKANNEILTKHIAEKDRQLKEQELFYRKKNSIFVIITLISVVLVIVCIVFRFA